jgi:penicillin-binding protein 2
VLPGPEWLSAVNPRARWTNGLTANTAIGQGDVLASPLQMAMVTAAVANGGTVYYPRLIDRVVDQEGRTIEQEPPRVRSTLAADGGLTAEQIERVRKGMWEVVNEGGGTAGRARNDKMPTAGKTGTAQFWRSGVKDNHTWFIAFAPYENPEYAVVVFVQGAKSGGGVSAPIAAKILREIEEYKAGGDIQIAALEPAQGNFLFTESIDFNRETVAVTKLADDGETADTMAAPGQESAPAAAPNVVADADEAGRVQNKTEPPTAKPNRNPLGGLFNFIGGNKKKDGAPPKRPQPERPGSR